MAWITSQIQFSNSDAAQSGAGGTVDVTGGALNANSDNNYIGLIFGGFSAAAGNVITAAALDLYFTSGSFDDPRVTLRSTTGVAIGGWSATNYLISTQPMTAASVDWTAVGIGTGWKTTPDIKSVIQEVADQPGWNGVIVIIIQGIDSSSFMRIRSYDGDSAQAAKLTVYYETSGQPAIARARLIPGMRRPHGSQGW